MEKQDKLASYPSSSTRYSIVIPIYNEEKILEELYRRLTRTMEALNEPYEIILINDGSKDSSMEIIRSFNAKDFHVKGIDFSRNFGHQTAISAGINHAAGDAVIVMDGDLQDPPEVLPQFINKWKEGWEVVYAIRKKRKENVFKRIAYALFYRLLQKVAVIDIPLDSGDFSLMDKKIVSHLKQMPERNRFVRGIRTWIGFRQTGIEYERAHRFAGPTKYTFTKLLKLAYDGIFSFSFTPLRVATNFGFIVSGLSFLGIFYVLYLRLIAQSVVPGFATTIILILFLSGIQLITIGILGEYIGRIFDEVKQRPLYIIKDSVGFDTAQHSTDSSSDSEKDKQTLA